MVLGCLGEIGLEDLEEGVRAGDAWRAVVCACSGDLHLSFSRLLGIVRRELGCDICGKRGWLGLGREREGLDGTDMGVLGLQSVSRDVG